MCSVIDHGHFAFPSLFIGATFYFIKGKIQRHCLKDLFIAPWIRAVQKHWCFLTCSSWYCFLQLLRGKFQWQGSACFLLAPLANVWDFHLGKWRIGLNSKQLSLLSEPRFWILTDTGHSGERKHKAWFMCAGCSLPSGSHHESPMWWEIYP